MIKYQVYNLKGEKAKDITLSENVFGLEKNDALLHQVYVSQYANRRQVIAHAKDRAERKGSGKKPWKQKGTGRARVGSVRTPVWRKGGVVFGPTKDRNFKKDIPQKMNQKSLAVSLSGKVADKQLVIIENFNLREVKTKEFAKTLANLPLKGSILIGFANAEKDKAKASRNLKKVDNIDAKNLNVFDILNHKFLVLSEEGVKTIEEKFKKEKVSQ